MALNKNDILDMIIKNIEHENIPFLFDKDMDLVVRLMPEGYKYYAEEDPLELNEKIKNKLSYYLVREVHFNFIGVINKYINYFELSELTLDDLNFFELMQGFSCYELRNKDKEKLLMNPLFVKAIDNEKLNSSKLLTELMIYKSNNDKNNSIIDSSDIEENEKVIEKDYIKNKNLELVKQFQETNDQEILVELYQLNKGLIRKIAASSTYAARMEYDDIEALAYETLYKVATIFDLSSMYSFSTLFVHAYRRNIYRYSAKYSRLVKVSPVVNDQLSRIYKVTNELRIELGYEPSPKDIADKMGLPEKKIIELLTYNLTPTSLDKPVDGADDSDSTFGDFIVSEIASPDREAEDLETRIDFEMILYLYSLRINDNRPIMIIRLAKGIPNYETEELLLKHPDVVKEHDIRVKNSMEAVHKRDTKFNDMDVFTLTEIAKMFGITRQRVQQILVKHLNRLRKLYDAYMDNAPGVRKELEELKKDEEWIYRRVRTIDYFKDNR